MAGVRRGRTFWAKAVEEFEASGLGQKTFCEEKDVHPDTFRQWRYRLRNEKAARTRKPSFVEVHAKPSKSSGACAVAVRIGGAEICFASRPEAAYLGALVRQISISR